jgi:hypothetical protein
MATDAASHILSECVALAEFKSCHLGEHFYETNYYEMPSCKIYFSEAWDYWWNKTDETQ